MTLDRPLCRVALLLALAAFLPGCSSLPDAPTKPTSSSELRTAELRTATGDELSELAHPMRHRGFYPLEPGNRWHYQRRFSVRIIGHDGEEIESLEFLSEIEREQTCVDSVNGRAYLVERIVETTDDETFRAWVRFRQDRRGLYEADGVFGEPGCDQGGTASRLAIADIRSFEDAAWSRVVSSIGDPATRAAFTRAWLDVRERLTELQRNGFGASPLRRHRGEHRRWRRRPAFPPDGELLRLSYPLFPGRRWIIREEPRFAARVERAEVLDLKPGRMFSWRIRYTNEFLGENDLIRLWYGRRGFLKLAAHIEGEATDNTGNHIGTVISENHQILDDLDLVRSGGLAVRLDAGINRN